MSAQEANGAPRGDAKKAEKKTPGKAAAKKTATKKSTRSGGDNAGDSSDNAPLVFPVGHYMGPFHPSRNGPAKHHIVRVGWETPKLPDEEHLDIWALAHGLPARLDSVRWTRQAIIDAADDAEMPNAEEILDNLAELRLITEVSPETGQAREFADAFRLQSLLIGLGNNPEDPVLDGIGLVGVPPVVMVRPRVFEIWQWAHLWPTIWAACEGLAYIAGETGQAESEAADPEKVLELMFEATRTLISRNAVYLDVAMTPPDDEATDGP